jgi:hypothetical protein
MSEGKKAEDDLSHNLAYILQASDHPALTSEDVVIFYKLLITLH